MRKIQSLLLCGAIGLAAFGCATQPVEAPVETPTPSASPAPAPTPTPTPTPTPLPTPTPPKEEAALECGEASYYADSLAGNPTASGAPYSVSKKTAAHRTLPFGTKLKVKRQDTDDSVVVTVNDRGPYAHNRIIDLSRAAATEIDLILAGHADVCLYVLED